MRQSGLPARSPCPAPKAVRVDEWSSLRLLKELEQVATERGCYKLILDCVVARDALLSGLSETVVGSHADCAVTCRRG
eukprot:scaffold3551_cov408-Prasinococcus_capsulatus_cf.AAC.16